MFLLKSILGKRKFLSTSMFRWRFLKKFLNVFFFVMKRSCRTFINKEFTGKSSLTSFCAESSEKKKKLGWSTIVHELKSVVKAKIAQNNSQNSEGGITVKPGQDSIHELIIWNYLIDLKTSKNRIFRVSPQSHSPFSPSLQTFRLTARAFSLDWSTQRQGHIFWSL